MKENLICPNCGGDSLRTAFGGEDGEVMLLHCDDCGNQFQGMDCRTPSQLLTHPEASILPGFRGIVVQDQSIFHHQLCRETDAFESCKSPPPERVIPGIFRAFLAATPAMEVVDGITSFSDEELEKDLISAQGVIFGYHGFGLIGKFTFNDEADHSHLSCVKVLEILGKFDLRNIYAPTEPFIQLRLAEVHDSGAITLGEVQVTLTGVTFFANALTR